jgi:hypothetical protein
MAVVQTVEIVIEKRGYTELNEVLRRNCLYPSTIRKVNDTYIIRFNAIQWFSGDREYKAVETILKVFDEYDDRYIKGYGYKLLCIDKEEIGEDNSYTESNNRGDKVFADYIIDYGMIIEPTLENVEYIDFKPLNMYNDIPYAAKSTVYNYMRNLNTKLFKLDNYCVRDEREELLNIDIAYTIIPSEEYVNALGEVVNLTSDFIYGLQEELQLCVEILFYDKIKDIAVTQMNNMLWITVSMK